MASLEMKMICQLLDHNQIPVVVSKLLILCWIVVRIVPFTRSWPALQVSEVGAPAKMVVLNFTKKDPYNILLIQGTNNCDQQTYDYMRFL